MNIISHSDQIVEEIQPGVYLCVDTAVNDDIKHNPALQTNTNLLKAPLKIRKL